jgi:hypothetical protein
VYPTGTTSRAICIWVGTRGCQRSREAAEGHTLCDRRSSYGSPARTTIAPTAQEGPDAYVRAPDQRRTSRSRGA